MYKIAASILAALMVISLIFGAGYYVADNNWQAKWDQQQKDIADNQNKAILAAITDYKDKLSKMERTENETKQSLANALLDADNAAKLADSLQQQIDNHLRNGSGTDTASASTAECKAIATDRLVLAELFKRADKRAGELAAALDDAVIKGKSCEKYYEVARHNK